MTTIANKLRRTIRLRREVAHREAALYGALLGDVNFLRRRGFSIHSELQAGRRFYWVGNRLLGATALRAVAARERRLLQTPTPTT